MKKIFTAAIALCSLLLQVSFAQNTISGKITNILNETPLNRVTIYIPELERTTLSNDQGMYTFTDLPTATIRLQFTMVGFSSVVKVVDSKSTPSLNVQLTTSISQLQEVAVTSNNTNLPSKIPFAVNSISQANIRNHSSPTLMGNLSYLPGVDKISTGVGIAKPVIRGLSFNRVMLYAQGTRIENQQWDDRHDLGLSDVGVERVEIVKGPAALIYGADAMGGVLIFVDEKPAPSGSLIGDAGIGFGSNTMGLNIDAGLKGANKNGLFYGIRVGAQSHTSYLQGESEEAKQPGVEKEEFAPNSKFMSEVVKANIGISKKWGVSKFSYSFLNQKLGIIEEEGSDTSGVAKNDEAEQRDRDIEAPYQDVSTHILSLENTILTGRSKLNVNVAYQLNDRKEFEPLDNKQKELAIGLKLNVLTYDVKWISNANKAFGITIGSQGTFLKNTNNGKESLVPDADVSNIAGYGLIRYDHKNFNLLGGIRYDIRKIEAEGYENNNGIEEDTFIMVNTNDTIDKPETDFNKNYKPLSFSLGGAYHFNDQLTLKVNAATGFTTPNYAQLATFGKHEGTYRFERGEEELKTEHNVETDLGLTWADKWVTVNLNGYINSINNYIYIANTGNSMAKYTPDGRDTLPVYDYKQGDATISGGEFGIDFHPPSIPWINLNTSYALISGKLKNSSTPLPYMPANKLVAELLLTKKKLGKMSDGFFSLTMSNFAKQNKVAAYELATDGYTLLDAAVGASFNIAKQKASLKLICTNLLNTGYFNQLSLVKYIGVRDMGRNIGIQLRVPFGK